MENILKFVENAETTKHFKWSNKLPRLENTKK